MKRILLTTTALTMTAGIAAAEVTVTGDLTLGFNDTGMTGTAFVPASRVDVLNDAGAVVSTTVTPFAAATGDQGPTGAGHECGI